MFAGGRSSRENGILGKLLLPDAPTPRQVTKNATLRALVGRICYSRFDIAARLTEIMLLRCVSLRVGQKIEWDGPKMAAKNCPQAAQFIRRQDRSGWALS